MKFFIRTTEERKLDSSIEKELGTNYELLIDKTHKPVNSFIEQLKYISNYDAILLEDDVILCKNFVKEIEKIIKCYPNKIINFFTAPFDYFTTYVRLEHFAFNQCTYYPKGVSKLIAEEMERNKNAYIQYDSLENVALRNLKIVHVKYRPCLVQHKDESSIIQKNKNVKRRTIYFKDYLDTLDISYEEAYTKENQNKLLKELKENFEK